MTAMDDKITQCVLLADIYQYELDPLNKDLPAILMPIGNVPLLEMLLHHLYVSAIETVYILYSKANDRIKTHLQHSRFANDMVEVQTYPCVCQLPQDYCQQRIKARPLLNIKFVETITNNPIYQLDSFLQHHGHELYASFLLINGPVVFNFSVKKMYQQHCMLCTGDNYLATVAIQKVDDNSLMRSVKYPFLIYRDDNNRLITYHTYDHDTLLLNFKKVGINSTISIDYYPTSIYIFRRDSFIPVVHEESQKQCSSLTKMIDTVLYGNMEIVVCVYDIQDYCAGRVDCPRTYRGINRAYLNRQFYPYTPDVNIFNKMNSRIVQQYFGQATIGKQLKLSGKLQGLSIVGNSCRIEGTVNGSILGDYVFIKSDTTVNDCILGDRVSIGYQCFFSDCIILDSTTVRNNVSLPIGSIIGSNISALNMDSVYHAIRCFAQVVWEKQINAYFDKLSRINKITQGDIALFERFIAGYETQLPTSLIIMLPPIYICRQYITKIYYERQRAIRELYAVPSTFPRPEKYEFPLPYIEIPIYKAVNEKYIEEDAGDEVMGDSDECDCYSYSHDSADEQSDIEVSSEPDELDPSQLAAKLVENKETLLTVQHWIPTELISRARQSLDLSSVQRSFLEQQVRHGFHCIPQRVFKHIPYLYINNFVKNALENAEKKQVIYSRFSLKYYEAHDDFGAMLQKPKREKTYSPWNRIVELFMVLYEDKEFYDCYICEKTMTSKRLVVQFCQNLQYFCIHQQQHKNFEISLDLPKILIVIAVWGQAFKGFSDDNEIVKCDSVSANATRVLASYLKLLEKDAGDCDAPQIFSGYRYGEDRVIAIATTLFDLLLRIQEDTDTLDFDHERLELAVSMLMLFVDSGVITAEDVREWVENQQYATEEYTEPSFCDRDEEDQQAVKYDRQLYYAVGVPALEKLQSNE